MLIRTLCASAALLAATSVSAQNLNIGTPECIIGGIAGGILGNQVGKGDGNKAAVAVGSLLGCATGQRIGNQEPAVIVHVPAPHGYGHGRPPVYPQQPQYGYENYHSNGGSAEQYYNRSYTWRDGRPFAPACFSQWMGSSQGQIPMTPQGRHALRNATKALGQSHQMSQEALMTVSAVQQRLQGLQMDAQNPQTRWIVGNSIDAQIDQAQREERRVLKQYKEAYETHNAVVEQTLRACEYSAVRGEDVSEFSSLLNYMDPLPVPSRR
jgi:hypothetical protein